MEAFKLVAWPREAKEVDGKMVHYYALTGIVMCDQPLGEADEIFVMDSNTQNQITELLKKAQRYHPRYQWGDATGVMLGLGHHNPQNCKKATVSLDEDTNAICRD